MGKLGIYKKCKNKCNSLTKTPKRIYFKGAEKDRITSNNKFWSTVKPFLTNKDCISNYFINVEKDGDLISNEKELVKILNQNYKNIIRNSSRNKASSLANCLNASMKLQLRKLYNYIVTILASKNKKCL